jgi:hypothetical protein
LATGANYRRFDNRLRNLERQRIAVFANEIDVSWRRVERREFNMNRIGARAFADAFKKV